ncbi:MAG: Endoribonuclease YbeY [Chlamydiae bacterium]|nr:Endoribonuclease YbeY [Chlamydiota bacterium]
MHIHIFNEQSDLPIHSSQVKHLILFVLETFKKKYDEMSVYFVSEEKICAMHQTFFDDPTSTDCISFPMDNENDLGYTILGEIFVCPKAAIDYANAQKKDVFEELSHYVVHGMLHLLGFRDDQEKLKKEMFKKQQSIINKLKTKKLLLAKSQ